MSQGTTRTGEAAMQNIPSDRKLLASLSCVAIDHFNVSQRPCSSLNNGGRRNTVLLCVLICTTKYTEKYY
jgi:hypothetical protein